MNFVAKYSAIFSLSYKEYVQVCDLFPLNITVLKFPSFSFTQRNLEGQSKKSHINKAQNKNYKQHYKKCTLTCIYWEE